MFSFTIAGAQSFERPPEHKLVKGVSKRPPGRKKQVRIHEPRTVSKAKREQQAQERKQERDYRKQLKEDRKRLIIVVEPEGLASDGSFVVAELEDGWTLRRLARAGDGWELRALDPAWPAVAIPDLAPVRGVVIQKSKPGRRRAAKRYVE